MKSRLTTHFLLRVFLIVVLFLIVTVFWNFWLLQQQHDQETEEARYPGDVLAELERTISRDVSRVQVPASLLSELALHDAWLQVLDREGREIYQFQRPDGVPVQYAPGELLYYRQSPAALQQQLYTWYAEQQGLTLIYGTPMLPPSASPSFDDLWPWLVTLLTGLLVALVIALLFGRQLGGPLLHMLTWIENLAGGAYAEPTGANGQPRSREEKTGQLRRPYRIYREVIGALEQLTHALSRNEAERRRLDRTREEWITGVSHDLKTPLSSVKGYAELLSTEHYTWTEQEVKQFSRVILEKSAYMEELIEDLNLTFRLKNNAMPLTRTPHDLVELVRRAAINLANHPRAAGQHVHFSEPPQATLIYPLDGKWFLRALDNLLINAAVHNPPGTNISVTVQQRSNGGVFIEIADDGAGMDEETVAHLFDRYYRGTNTADTQGGGTGLGTAIAKQLIDAHRGEVTLDSTPGVGTNVSITLPPLPPQN